MVPGSARSRIGPGEDGVAKIVLSEHRRRYLSDPKDRGGIGETSPPPQVPRRHPVDTWGTSGAIAGVGGGEGARDGDVDGGRSAV